MLILLALLLFISPSCAQPKWNIVATTDAFRPRGEGAFARCSTDSLCLLGGRGISPVSILDTSTLTWTQGQSPPNELHHFQAIQGPDSCAWVVGAWTGPFPAEDSVQDIWRYCIDSDEWSTVTTIPRPRGAAGTVYYKGAVYLVSGNVGGHNPDARLVSWFDKYDPQTNQWTVLPDVPHPRDHFNAAVLGSKLYVAGGRDSADKIPDFFNNVETAVDVYDFETAQWSTIEDFPRPRGGTMATTFNNDLYVLGGEGQGRAWVEVDVLRSNAFQPAADMPQPRHGSGVVACNGAMWVAGGADVQGGSSSATDTLAFFDGPTPPACSDTLPTTLPSTTTVAALTTPASDVSTSSPVTTAPSTNMPVSPPESSMPSKSPTASQPQETPTESASTNSGNDSNNPACFPSHATVQLSDGSVKKMAELRIGDHVKVAHPNVYSPIYFFSHSDENAQADVLRIKTALDEISLSVSAGHLLYVNGVEAAASTVRVGDVISVSHDTDETARVVAVSTVRSTGLFNPHTIHGDIVVDRVIASTYTSAVHPSLARAALAPIRMLYRVTGPHEVIEVLNRGVLRVLAYTVWKNT